jgi:hypothetical protein
MCVSTTAATAIVSETGLSPFTGAAVSDDVLLVRFPPPGETVNVELWYQGILNVLDVEVGLDPSDVSAVNLYADHSVPGGEVVAAVSLGSSGRAQMLQIELGVIGYHTLAMRVDGAVRVGVVQVDDVDPAYTTSAPTTYNLTRAGVIADSGGSDNTRCEPLPAALSFLASYYWLLVARSRAHSLKRKQRAALPPP